MKLSFSDHSESIRLAYELQAYLNDDRAYEPACPPICTSCGNNVPNPTAHYCGRCGYQFVADGVDGAQPILRPPPVVVASPRSLERETPSIMIEREDRRVAPREDVAESLSDSTAADDGAIDLPDPGDMTPVRTAEDDAAQMEDPAPDDEFGNAGTEESIVAPQEEDTGERAAEAIDIDEEDAVADGEDNENEAADDDNEASGEADDQPRADRDDAPRTSRRLLAEE